MFSQIIFSHAHTPRGTRVHAATATRRPRHNTTRNNNRLPNSNYAGGHRMPKGDNNGVHNARTGPKTVAIRFMVIIWWAANGEGWGGSQNAIAHRALCTIILQALSLLGYRIFPRFPRCVPVPLFGEIARNGNWWKIWQNILQNAQSAPIVHRRRYEW